MINNHLQLKFLDKIITNSFILHRTTELVQRSNSSLAINQNEKIIT